MPNPFAELDLDAAIDQAAEAEALDPPTRRIPPPPRPPTPIEEAHLKATVLREVALDTLEELGRRLNVVPGYADATGRAAINASLAALNSLTRELLELARRTWP